MSDIGIREMLAYVTEKNTGRIYNGDRRADKSGDLYFCHSWDRKRYI
jgi:hypothetical protein